MKIRCNLCGRKVTNDAVAKWRHVLKYHPSESLKRLLPLLTNPERAREVGAYLGQQIKRGFVQ